MAGRAARRLSLLIAGAALLPPACDRRDRVFHGLLARARAATETQAYDGVVRFALGGREGPSEVRFRVQVDPPRPPVLQRLDRAPEAGDRPAVEPRSRESRRGGGLRRRMGPGLDRIDLVLRNYHPSLDGEDTVADRPVLVLGLRPRHAGRFAWRLWLDGETGLPLRTEERGPQGQVESASCFEEFTPRAASIPAPGGPEVAPQPPHREPVTVEEARSRLPFRPILPGLLPPGFELTAAHLTRSDGPRSPRRRPKAPGGAEPPAETRPADPAPATPDRAAPPPGAGGPPPAGGLRLHLVFSDGLEKIVAIQSPAEEPEVSPVHRGKEGRGPRRESEAREVRAGSRSDLVVKRRDLGSHRMFHFLLGGTKVVLFGRIPEEEMLLMIETAEAR